MQFLDIYTNDSLLARVPLGETDLLTLSSSDWDKDVVYRERIVKVMIRQLKSHPVLMRIKNKEYYLVFESRVHLTEEFSREQIIEELINA